MEFGMKRVTRSPFATPRRASEAARRSVRASSSVYVTVRSPRMRAGFTATSRATSRSRACSAASRYVNVAAREAVTAMRSPLRWLEPADSRALDDRLRFLVLEPAQPRGAQHLAHQLVVRHAREEVVAARGDVVARRPFLPLEVDVRPLIVLLEALKELAERVAHRVLRRERDEDEPIAERAELAEPGRIRFVEPLE